MCGGGVVVVVVWCIVVGVAQCSGGALGREASVFAVHTREIYGIIKCQIV
jgi:hypothetical protein